MFAILLCPLPLLFYKSKTHHMNKKIILTFIGLFGAIIVNAQTQKGDQLLGGGIGFSTGKGSLNYTDNPYNDNGTFKAHSFSIAPAYSYFIANNIDLGAAVGYTNQKTSYNYITGPSVQNQDLIQNRSYTLSASIYLRKYFLFNNKIGIRTGPFAAIQKNHSEQDYIQPVYNFFYHNYSYSAGIDAAVVFFPSKRLGFSANLGSLAYSHDDNKQLNYHSSANSFGLNLLSNGLFVSAFYSFEK